jgi:MOSC domain-containing protein YiiM
MRKRPNVRGIYIAPGAGEEMLLTHEAMAIAGKGLENDRYGLGTGAFSKNAKIPMHVTLIEQETIHAVNNEPDYSSFTPAQTRRNILTRGVRLNNLVGLEFGIGEDVIMKGIELAAPCGRPSKLSGVPGFKEAFENRGGLRAEILNSGLIAVGDTIRVPKL